MDYTVDIDGLWEHGRNAGAAAHEAEAVTSAVRLDAAGSAMPGSLSAGASSKMHGRFQRAAGSFVESLEKYSEAARSAADGYRRQEDRATDAINSFFGG